MSTLEPTGHARLRITARGRVVLALLIAIPLGIGAVGAQQGLAAATSSEAEASFRYVTVKAGQSLWSLAESLAPAADPRDVILEIVSLNALPSSEVEAGQRLAIPHRYAS